MHPIRLRRAQAGPFAGWLLSPAMKLQMMPVDVKSAPGVPSHGAYSKGDFTGINNFATRPQTANRLINIGIRGLPQLRFIECAGHLQSLLSPGSNWLALLQAQNGFSI